MPTRNERNKAPFDNIKSFPRNGSGISANEISAALGENASAPLKTLLADARRVAYQPRDVLYHAGNEIDAVLFITEGLVKLVAHLANGSERIVRLHRPGSVLGLGGLREQGSEHTAVAVTPVTALQLPLNALRHLRSNDPTTYAGLTERWHDYLQAADTWITEFSTGSIRARVARLLAFLTEYEPDAADGHVQLLTCEEMGSILGVTGESVSRVLADFKRQHVLERDNSASSDVYEADVERLYNIAEEE